MHIIRHIRRSEQAIKMNTTLYLSQEVNLKAGCPVALGLPIVQVIPHSKYKLRAKKKNTLNDNYKQHRTFVFAKLQTFTSNILASFLLLFSSTEAL